MAVDISLNAVDEFSLAALGVQDCVRQLNPSLEAALARRLDQDSHPVRLAEPVVV